MNGKRRNGTYTQRNSTQPPKREIMLFAATQMDLEMIIQSEVSQARDKRQIPYDITHMCNLKQDAYLK